MQVSQEPNEHNHLLHEFEKEVDVEYRGERYRVRDNGSVYRRNRYRKRARPLDKQWTFGRQSPSTGYQLLAGVPVHRIVCSAFNGPAPAEQYVVDHIDTNRANNRPENLRWLTRLENTLLNPISARRIELVYGSIEAFFADPSKLQGLDKFPDISWMRSVSAEEAQYAKKRLQEWASSGSVPSGGALGEWLYGTRERADFEAETEEYESLTPSAIQVKWRVPTEFPCCPELTTENALSDYAEGLSFGTVFARNDHYHSVVVDRRLSEDGLIVLTNLPTGVKDWAVAIVTMEREIFYHKSAGTFHSIQGAVKQFCNLSGEDFMDSIDDYL